MTRENKISIVIAFGLMIFVGMLVADHFSIATHREVANLGSNVSTPPLISPTTLLDGPPPQSSFEVYPRATDDYTHIVQSGDTLRSICLDFYGDSGLAAGVATWNNIQNPNAIEKGLPVALPTRALLVIGNMPTFNQIKNNNEAEQTAPADKMGSYIVKDGDTLSEIAQKVMGTTKKTQLLIDVNKDVMPNPDRIRPGMVLQYPLQSL